MMKFAAFVLSSREYRLGCERLLIIKFAFRFGADLVNACAFSEIRSIPLYIVKVVALKPKFRWYRGVLPRPIYLGRVFLFFVKDTERKYI